MHYGGKATKLAIWFLKWWRKAVWRNRAVLPGCGCQVPAVLAPSWTQAFQGLGSVFYRDAGASCCLRATASVRLRS